jgi:membrane protease YdiL (CAAX protease family)
MVYESSDSYKIGFLIDFLKYSVCLVVISYAWIFIQAKLASVTTLPLKTVFEIKSKFADVYIYFAILGLITVSVMLADRVIYKYDITPTYQKGIKLHYLLPAIMFASLLFVGTLLGSVRVGETLPFNPLDRYSTALINGVKGLIENGFFIAFLGFSIWTLLSGGAEHRNIKTAVPAAIITALIAVAWHIYKLVVIYQQYSMSVVMVAAIQIFVFFFIMALYSFITDNVWGADIIHFANNAALALFGTTAYVIV